jgi:hypothetical protein
MRQRKAPDRLGASQGLEDETEGSGTASESSEEGDVSFEPHCSSSSEEEEEFADEAEEENSTEESVLLSRAVEDEAKQTPRPKSHRERSADCWEVVEISLNGTRIEEASAKWLLARIPDESLKSKRSVKASCIAAGNNPLRLWPSEIAKLLGVRGEARKKQLRGQLQVADKITFMLDSRQWSKQPAKWKAGVSIDLSVKTNKHSAGKWKVQGKV